MLFDVLKITILNTFYNKKTFSFNLCKNAVNIALIIDITGTYKFV